MAVVSGFFGLGGAGFRLVLVLSDVIAERQQAIREVDVLDDGFGILDLQLRDTVNAREMQPDGTYTKVHPAEGQPPVDSQMAMFGYFKDGFEMAPEKPRPEPKAAPKPQAAAAKAVVKPVVRQRAALRPKRASLLQSLFGRGKK